MPRFSAEIWSPDFHAPSCPRPLKPPRGFLECQKTKNCVGRSPRKRTCCCGGPSMCRLASFYLARTMFCSSPPISTPQSSILCTTHRPPFFCSCSRWRALFLSNLPLPIKEFAIPVAAKVLETFLSSIVHSQNRTGGLYVLRIFDVITTVAIVYWGKQFGLSDKEKPANKHLLLLGLAASLSWLEFGQMEYTFFSFICSPLLALARAYSILSVWRLAQKLRPPSLDLLTMYYCGLTALALALPALISFSSRTVEVTASWESIDTVLMYLSPIFMASALYSELWLCLVAGPKTFQVAEHGKYFLASLGQWIIQNMAHPSILALIGKILFVGSAVRAVAHGFSE
ncbi:unnamed protein product, partial [Mesorhabditis spiculigera]